MIRTYLDSKKFYLIGLGIVSVAGSKIFFFLISFNDPEGANLLIVTVLAAVLYIISLALNSFIHLENLKKLLSAIFIQACIVTILYFGLK